MPTAETTAIVRSDLGTIAWEYMIDAAGFGFIGLELLPIFGTKKQAGEYPVLNIETFLKLQKTQRAPRGSYNRSDYQFGKGNYSCQEFGWEELLDDSEKSLYGQVEFDAESIAVMRATDILMRGQEARVAGIVQDLAVFDDAAVNVIWTTAASATPRSDIMTAKTFMRDTYGIIPNVITMSEAALSALLFTTEITDALKYTNPIEIGGRAAQLRVLEMYFGIDRILIHGSQKDTAAKGQANSLADIWDKTKVGLYKVSSAKDLKEPSLGRTFLWDEDSPENLVTEQYREEQVRSDVFRVRHNVGEKLTFTGAGYILTGAVA